MPTRSASPVCRLAPNWSSRISYVSHADSPHCSARMSARGGVPSQARTWKHPRVVCADLERLEHLGKVEWRPMMVQNRCRSRSVGFPPPKGRISARSARKSLKSFMCSFRSTAVEQRASTVSQGANGHEGLGQRTRSQTRHVKHHGASGVEEYRLRRRDGTAWRDIGNGETKACNINGLARAALEREKEIKAYGAEAADQGWFPGRPGRDACVAARAHVWLGRFPGEPGWFTKEPGATLGRTGAVPGRTTAYDGVPYITVLSEVFRMTLCVAVILSGYGPLTIDLQHRARRHSGLYGRRASWEHGDWRPRRAPGLHRPQPQQARCPPCRGSSVTEPCLASSGRGTLPPGNSADTGGAGASGSPRTCKNTSRTVVRFPAGVKQTGVNKAMPGVAARATTLTRPLLSVVAQMCRTFQNSPVNGVVQPCRDGMPGTLLSESRRRMSSRVTRALPNRATLRDVDLTDRKGTWAPDGMQDEP